MPSRIFQNIYIGLGFLLLSFPLFYFVYKYGDPEPLAHDFFQYYRLYKNLDVANVNAPFNMRLVGAAVVRLFYEFNFFYDTETAFDKYQQWGFLKQVYFNAVCFNWLCVVATCTMLYRMIRSGGLPSMFAFLGGLLYLFGFGTLFYHLMPLTEACSALLFTWFLWMYLKKNYWGLLPLALLIFQREYLLLAVGLMTLMDWLKWRDRYFIIHAVAACLCFVIYYILRKTVFYTTALDFQSRPDNMLLNLLNPGLNWGEYWKQFLLTANLLLLYMGLVAFKYYRNSKVNGYEFLRIVLLLLQVHLLSISGGHGNNAGRYFYLLVPLIIIQLVNEAAPLMAGEEGRVEPGKS